MVGRVVQRAGGVMVFALVAVALVGLGGCGTGSETLLPVEGEVQYEGKPLAKGGMGEIYLAAGGEVGGFEKLCVIKKVITEKADRTKANRFLDEAKVVLRLSHSALVNTFDAGEVNGEFYIAMELVEGKDLREIGLLVGSGGVLRHNPPAVAARILAGIGAGAVEEGWLVPTSAKTCVDDDYVLAGVGLLAGVAPEVAAGLGDGIC